MSKYIDKDALIAEFKRLTLGENSFIERIFADGVYAVIDTFPAADVVEVRHSKIKWVNRPIAEQYATVTDEHGEKHYGKVHDRIENNPVGYCGECGRRLDDTFMKFCPNCGAKMDGERSGE